MCFSVLSRPFSYLAICSLFLTGCGGGGSAETDDKQDSTEQRINVNISHKLLSQLPDDQEYFVISESGQTNASIAEGTLTNKAPEENELVLLSSEFGEPMAVGIRHRGDSSVQIDLTSSATVFVLRHERFFGVEFDDLNALQSRIRSHPQFVTLVEKLQAEIDDKSPCPMNPNCSFLATITADEIASTLSLDGLTMSSGGGQN